MVEFTKDVPLREPAAPVGNFFSSRGSDAFGKLFEGIGDIGKGLANLNTQTNVAGIEEDIFKGVTSVQTEMGLLPNASERGTDPGLNSQLERLAKIQEALRNSPQHFRASYSAKINSLVRDIKAKYGFRYGETIDKRIAQTIGFNPNEAILDAYMKVQEGQLNATAVEAKDWREKVMTDETALRLFGDRLNTTDPDERREIRRVVLSEKAREASWAYSSKKSNEENSANANKTANNIVMGHISQITSHPDIAKMLSGKTDFNSNEVDQIREAIVGFENQLRTQLLVKLSEYEGLTAKEKEEIISNSLKVVGHIKGALDTKDLSLITYISDLAKNKDNMYINELSKNLSMEERMRLKESGQVFWDDFQKTNPDADFIRTQALLNTGMPLSVILKQLSVDGEVSEERANKLGFDLVNDAANYIKSEGVPLADRVKKARDFLAPENISSIMKMTDKGHDTFISIWGNEDIGKVVNDSGDENLKKDYIRSISGVLDTDYFKNLAQSVSEGAKEFKNGQFLWDDKTQTLIFSSAEVAPSVRTRGSVGLESKIDKRNQFQKTEVLELNSVLSNLINAAAPISGGEMGETFKEALRGMGINIVDQEMEDKKQGPEASKEKKTLEAPTLNQGDKERRQVSREFFPLRDAIAIGEGTKDAAGYDRMLAGAEKQFGIKLTDMTIDEVIGVTQSPEYREFTRGVVGRVATPVGKYQIVGATLKTLKEELRLDGSEPFNEETQDKMFLALLNRRGLKEFRAQKISIDEFMGRLSEEWHGLKNNATSRREMVKALQELLNQ